jgi:hypothetical protein
MDPGAQREWKLRIVAGAVFMFGYWICMVLASVPLLPAGTFPRFQMPVMLVAALLAAPFALVAVRQQRAYPLAFLIPVLIVLDLVLFNLMQTPTQAGRSHRASHFSQAANTCPDVRFQPSAGRSVSWLRRDLALTSARQAVS